MLLLILSLQSLLSKQHQHHHREHHTSRYPASSLSRPSGLTQGIVVGVLWLVLVTWLDHGNGRGLQWQELLW